MAPVIVNVTVSHDETPDALPCELEFRVWDVFEAVPALFTVQFRGPVFLFMPIALIVTVTFDVVVRAEKAGVVIEPA